MLPLVSSASTTLAGPCSKAVRVTIPLFLWQEDSVREEREFVDVGKGQVLVPMEELPYSLVILDVKRDTDTSEKLPKDVLSIGIEFFLSMWVGPMNHC